MAVTTRKLDPDGWAEWRSVRLRALADAPTASGSALADWIDASEDRWRARLRDVPLNVIAVVDDELVGQVSATTKNPASTIELIAMWVSPAARGAGVGDALTAAVTSWAATHHATAVELCVKTANTPARRLYERNNFSTSGLGDTSDEVRMTRNLA